MPSQNRIIYVGDPMCSWCWGISAELGKFAHKHQEDYPLLVIAGGLRPGTTDPMDEELTNFLQHHWAEVHERTGQPFTYDLLKDHTFVYDTEVPCRAVVTVRELAPEKTFAFFKQVQECFYVKNQNTNQIETYLEICKALAIDPQTFQHKFEGSAMRQRTQADFELTSRLGVRGFPAVLLQTGEQVQMLANGYATEAQLEQAMVRALKQVKSK
ncbi:MAG: DsbA family protein [Salibacteraceae bacterium]